MCDPHRRNTVHQSYTDIVQSIHKKRKVYNVGLQIRLLFNFLPYKEKKAKMLPECERKKMPHFRGAVEIHEDRARRIVVTRAGFELHTSRSVVRFAGARVTEPD